MFNGFYKSNQETYIYAPTKVTAPNYTLDVTIPSAHTYPIDGWVYYDDINTALTALGITLESYTDLDEMYSNDLRIAHPHAIIGGVITQV